MALKLILALTVVPLASCSRLPPLRGLAQVRLDDAWLQRPVGPRRVAPGQKPPDSGNITAVKALDAISRHWLIYERIFSLALRAVGGASKALRSGACGCCKMTLEACALAYTGSRVKLA